MWFKECGAGLFLLLIISGIFDVSGSFVGVNINISSLGLPQVSDISSTIQSRGIRHVRLLTPDHQLLSALANTGVEVMVNVPNDRLLRVGLSQAEATRWLMENVVAFHPATNITYIAVGSEVLTEIPYAAPVLVPAMNFLQSALVAANLSRQVKISTPHSMGLIPNFFPPSAATFNFTRDSIIHDMLQFLKSTSSSFMLNASPYKGYMQGNGVFPLGFALFRHQPLGNMVVDPNTDVSYDNMLDAMVDAAYYSINARNFSGIPVMVTETGWPWLASALEPDATADNALIFNNNLIRHVSAQTNRTMNAYIYELFDTGDSQDGHSSGSHWGLFFLNGTAVYPIDFSRADGENATSTGMTKEYCVADPGADPRALAEGLNWACGQGSANCTAIQPGQPCYSSSIVSIASYAYNEYYHRARAAGGTCDFGGTALTTTIDPSFGSCMFEGRLVSRTTNGSSGGGSGGSGGRGSGGIDGGIAPSAFGPTSMTNGISNLQFSWKRTSLMVILIVIMVRCVTV